MLFARKQKENSAKPQRKEEPRIAVLIDAENISASSLATVFDSLAEEGSPTIRLAFGSSSEAWQAAQLAFALELVYCQKVSKNGKNAADIALTVEAMKLLTADQADHFVLVSSDSDFTPLILQLVRAGKKVWVFGTATTPPSLRKACHQFHLLSKEKKEPSTAKKKTQVSTNPPTPASASPELLKQLFADTKAQPNSDSRTLANLGSTIRAAGYVPRDFGEKNFSEIFAASPDFKTKQVGSGRYLVSLVTKPLASKFSPELMIQEIDLIKSIYPTVEKNEEGYVSLSVLHAALNETGVWNFERHKGKLKKRLIALPECELHPTNPTVIRLNLGTKIASSISPSLQASSADPILTPIQQQDLELQLEQIPLQPKK